MKVQMVQILCTFLGGFLLLAQIAIARAQAGGAAPSSPSSPSPNGAAGSEFPTSVLAYMREQASSKASSATSTPKDEEEEVPPPSSACSLYLAKSSIPNAGWGVFATRDFAIGDRIGTPSVGIPFLDMPSNRGDTTFIYGALSEYLWESADIGAFGEALRVDLFLPGPASLVNHHASLDNVLAGGLTRDGNFYRHSSPMAGATTAYHGFHLIAKRDIKQGEELFVDRTRNARFAHTAYSTNLPSEEDYQLVDDMVSAIGDQLGLRSSSSGSSGSTMSTGSTLTEAQIHDMLHRLANEVIVEGYPKRAQVLKSLFPKSIPELEKCWQMGSAKFRLVERSLDWIQNNGYCLDTITSKPSTLSNAGQGAFAARHMSKGSIVSVSPMVTVSNGPVAMEVPYTSQANTPPQADSVGVSDDNYYLPEIRSNATQQLLTNYCFGHAHSNLMLCPTTQAALINHADASPSSMPKEDYVPNVAIRWSTATATTSEDPQNPLTLGSFESIININQTDLASYNTRLVMEYVALRPIEAGEELFLDYSSSWKDALKNHLEHGHSSSANAEPSHIPSKRFNELGRPVTLSVNIRSQRLAYFCTMYPNIKVNTATDAEPQWEDFATNSAVDKTTWPTKYRQWYKHNDAASAYPCNVVRVDESRDLHDVELLLKPLSLARVGRKLRDVPGDRIKYTDSLYQTDMHLEWAFRQYIPIPDSIFPLRWRRDYKSAQDWKLGAYANVAYTKAYEEKYERALREAKCGVYIAPSNIPNAGLGTYTAVDIPAGGIMVAASLPSLPSVGANGDYVWESSGFHLASFETWPKLANSILSVLFGGLANAHAGVWNMDHDYGEWSPVLDATQDYGAGAFSDYVNDGFRSKYAIAAGEELFISYGEHWFRGRSKFDDVPLSENFQEANKIVSSVWALLNTDSIDNDEDFVAKFLPLIRDHFIEKDNRRTISVLNAIQTLDDLRHVMARNGTAEATVQARSQEWLETNGYCQDHLYVKESTIPNAGNGAFTRRFLPKDSLILASPALVHRRDTMFINSTQLREETNDYQLMINYHFGHKNSSAMFFPATTAVAINHNSDRTTSGKSANARLQFSTTDKRSIYYQNLPLEDLLKEQYSTMVIEIVATRDIEPDEEVFLDYGEDWEEAWTKYVKEWKSPCGSVPESSCFKSSKRVKAMNQDKFNAYFHTWSTSHITTCEYNETAVKERGETFLLNKDIPKDFNHAVDPRQRLSYEGINYDHEGFSLPKVFNVRQQGDYMGRPCKLLGSSQENQTFDAVYFLGPSQQDPNGARKVARLKDVPARDVQFHLRPFRSDMMAAGTFRHEIAFPDESFPPLWKDLESWVGQV